LEFLLQAAILETFGYTLIDSILHAVPKMEVQGSYVRWPQDLAFMASPFARVTFFKNSDRLMCHQVANT
jgi:hypothetical protein